MTTRYTGEPRLLANLADDETGSVHDEKTARALGYQGAFVPGSIVATHAIGLITDHWGERWFEGGWYRFKFISPVYSNVAVTRSAQIQGNEMLLSVADCQGLLCCAGEAGLGYNRPWQDKAASVSAVEAGTTPVFATTPPGTELGEWTFRLDPVSGDKLVDAAADDAGHCRSISDQRMSAPPELLMEMALKHVHQHEIDLSGTRGPGMWTQHELALSKALLFDHDYRLKQWVADSGYRGGKPFIDFEFTVSDRGQQVAQGRHQSKWLPFENV